MGVGGHWVCIAHKGVCAAMRPRLMFLVWCDGREEKDVTARLATKSASGFPRTSVWALTLRMAVGRACLSLSNRGACGDRFNEVGMMVVFGVAGVI